MELPNIFEDRVYQNMLARIHTLTPATQPQWGKMNVAQMLAHCSVTYEMQFTNKHKPPGAFLQWVLKKMVKPNVTNTKPYKTGSRTAPQFIIADERDFETEKSKLLAYLAQAHSLGQQHFEGLKNPSFGTMTATEYANMFYKHLNHHLTQFGV